MTATQTLKTGASNASVFMRIGSFVTAVERIVAVIAGLSVFGIMVIVFVDVLCRYFLNAPLTFAYDLIGLYLLPLSFFFALSDTFRRNHHVAVDIFYLTCRPVVQRLFRLIAAVLGVLVFIPISSLALRQASERLANADVIGGSILWPTWIPSAFVFVGFALLLIRLLADGAALVAALARNSEDVPGESPDRTGAHSLLESLP